MGRCQRAGCLMDPVLGAQFFGQGQRRFELLPRLFRRKQLQVQHPQGELIRPPSTRDVRSAEAMPRPRWMTSRACPKRPCTMCNRPRDQCAQASPAGEPISRAMRMASSKSRRGLMGTTGWNRPSAMYTSSRWLSRPVRLEPGWADHPAPGRARWPDHSTRRWRSGRRPTDWQCPAGPGCSPGPAGPLPLQRSPGLPDDAHCRPRVFSVQRTNCPSSSGCPPEPPDRPSAGPVPVLARNSHGRWL